jgi:hypothetical protein
MKHIKKYNEGFLDFFKPKETYDDKLILKFINRIKNSDSLKIKDVTNNLPNWVSKCQSGHEPEYYNKIYLVEFSDVNVLITSDRHDILNNDNNIISSRKCNYKWKIFMNSMDMCEHIKAIESIRKKMFIEVDNKYKELENKKRIERIDTEINDSEYMSESIGTEIVFKGKRNPNLVIMVKKGPDGRITSIVNKSGIRFPFQIGQLFQRNIETWACNNNFYMDGKDTCPEKKIFGVRASDVPKGHEWRHIYPNRFKK